VNCPEYDLSLTDGVTAALDSTRVLRMALNVLYEGMDELYPLGADPAAKHRFEELMSEVHEHLTRAELGALSRCGLAEFFTVIMPLSPLAMPPPGALAEITAAVRTLEGHGLLALQGDALARDRDEPGAGGEHGREGS
jgi:hypothetical protein